MVDLKGVCKVKAKGRVYYYAWRGGPRLKSAPGSPAFIQELSALHEAHKRGDPAKIRGLITEWKASPFWQDPPEKGGIAHTTRKNWAPWLDKIGDYFGKLSTAAFDRPEMRPRIKHWRAGYRQTPRAADMGKQVLSALLSFAVDEGKLQANPCLGMKNLYHADRSEIIWTDSDLARLEKTASKEIMWALRLACLTGLRQSDLLKLAWSHVGELAIEMRTGKSGGRKTALIPMYGELRDVLAAIPKRASMVLTNTDELPWKSGFGSSWNKAMIGAGEEVLHFHDARGTAATKFYLAGFKIREIAELLAWSEDKVERIIARYVTRDAILRDKIRRMDENAAGTDAAKPSAKPAQGN